jgi:uridine kinase
MSVILIGVAGGTGSGKTSLAEAITARVGAEKVALSSP